MERGGAARVGVCEARLLEVRVDGGEGVLPLPDDERPAPGSGDPAVTSTRTDDRASAFRMRRILRTRSGAGDRACGYGAAGTVTVTVVVDGTDRSVTVRP